MGDIIERRGPRQRLQGGRLARRGLPRPRDWDGSFLWPGFPHRSYTFGDEQIDPNTIHIPCTACGGTGLAGGVMHDNLEHDEACDGCAGYGYAEGTTKLSEIIAWATKEYDALVVRPVSMTDHSGTYFASAVRRIVGLGLLRPAAVHEGTRRGGGQRRLDRGRHREADGVRD